MIGPMNGFNRFEAETPASTPKGLVPFGTFLEANPRMRPTVVNRFIREGEVINIIAATKIGKSWMAADLAMCVATGRRWLNRFETSRGCVIYVDNELHHETLASRFDRIATHREFNRETLEKNFLFAPIRGASATLTDMDIVLEQAEGRDIKLIVLNAFYRFLPEGTSENDNAQMMSLYNQLDGIARRLKCAFVIIHHASKGQQGGKQITDVGSGAGSISRAADTHLVIRPHETEGMAVMEAATRSFPPLDPLSIRFDFPCWEGTDEEAVVKQQGSAHAEKEAKRRKDDMDSIVEHFRDQRPFSTTDANKHIGGGFNRCAALVKELLNNQEIVLHSRFIRKKSSEETDHYTTNKLHQFDPDYGRDQFYDRSTTPSTTTSTTVPKS